MATKLPLITQTTRSVLRILEWPGIGVVRVRDLLRQPRSGRDIETAALRHWSTSMPMLANKVAAAADKIELIVSKQEEDCAQLGISIVSMADEHYPEQLRTVAEAPPVLYVRGNVAALNTRCVAVVGTRESSPAGERAAMLIAETLASKGITVVSGLAFGIDAAAHKGTLKVGGVTIAVLAHGLDSVSPASHKDLAREIIENNGALVSEHPPGVPARKAEFVRRNRIQSGLSFASIVVESGEQGGAIHQANFTVSQGRQLFTVLPNPSEQLGAGLNTAGAEVLISRFNATALRGTRDLVRATESLFSVRSISSRPPQRSGLFG